MDDLPAAWHRAERRRPGAGQAHRRALERVQALRADAPRARDRAHQRTAAAQRLAERAATALREAERARDRAAQLCADQIDRRAVKDFA
ncbi:hypothetical protein GCM10010166_44990 [Couchioplanes caeruleus subsp. azureus]|nr:hypothetical protein GCM10010166_44990 [Couchioplanes caeruleus subsp. azureus]